MSSSAEHRLNGEKELGEGVKGHTPNGWSRKRKMRRRRHNQRCREIWGRRNCGKRPTSKVGRRVWAQGTSPINGAESCREVKCSCEKSFSRIVGRKISCNAVYCVCKSLWTHLHHPCETCGEGELMQIRECSQGLLRLSPLFVTQESRVSLASKKLSKADLSDGILDPV